MCVELHENLLSQIIESSEIKFLFLKLADNEDLPEPDLPKKIIDFSELEIPLACKTRLFCIYIL